MSEAPDILKLVQNRLPTTHRIATIENDEIVETIDEVLVLKGFVDDDGEPTAEGMTRLQKSWIADLSAIKVLTAQINRYMEDPKVKAGSDAVEVEYPDKLKYIKAQIDQLKIDAAEKEASLGTGSGGYVPNYAVKVGVKPETYDE